MALSRRGSRPGDPLADAIFGFVFGRCRVRARSRLRAEGLLVNVPWSGHRECECGGDPAGGQPLELAEIAYADNTALPIIFPAMDVLDKMVLAAAVVLRGFWGHGWRPNLGEGKTEAIIRVSGPRC